MVNNKSGKKWRCIGVYGHPQMKQKKHTWTLLRRLARLSSYPWLYFGDFNEILHMHENIGGNNINLSMMVEF